MTHYNYIFSGSGLSALMVLNEFMNNEVLVGKKVLLIDLEKKNRNDKTWCFWEEGSGRWDVLVCKSWTKGLFVSKDRSVECLKGGMKYKMIQSEDFYRYMSAKVEKYAQIETVEDRVLKFEELGSKVVVTTTKGEFTCDYLFNSVLDLNVLKNDKSNPLLLQHFKGWYIETKDSMFDPEEIVFMDFSIPQNGNTQFVYLLPLSDRMALVEYTLFSPDVLDDLAYDKAIEEYLLSKHIYGYTILRKEEGVIPMSTYPFWRHNTDRILNIGSAGGWTKASTGYTFKNTSELARKVAELISDKTVNFKDFLNPNRFRFYDALLLDILYNKNGKGSEIFCSLFTKVDSGLIFKFLDEKTSIWEEFKLVMGCPKKLFIEALLKRFLR